ncbi:MAG: S8 family serine peptidase [Bacteroidales bacterium]|nr:S8 family serine peptidase [Bacteroidales bacterium]
MKCSCHIGLFLFVCSLQINAQLSPGWYRVQLTDKNHSSYTIERPEEFLSARALQRRANQDIPIVENDLPVSRFYLDSLKKLGIPVKNTSKWFNSVVTWPIDTLQARLLKNLNFVSEIVLVRPDPDIKKNTDNHGFKDLVSISELDYGQGLDQIAIHNGNKLHQLGYTGKGIHMAVIDAGFKNAASSLAFEKLWGNNQILGYRDFAIPGSDVFNEHSHGTAVLSVIASYIPGVLTGTAPDASFWLLRSEDANSEYLIEEDNWVSAAEFADSAGADVINTSLGYTRFDLADQNHTYEEIDGNTTRISRAANTAASKGMLLVNSAGNDGTTDWKYISAPADADSVMAVAATDFAGNIAYFSSKGPSADGRIKPDVSAIGLGTYIFSYTGLPAQSRGTSVSSPVIAGLAACLWQANRHATNMQVFQAIIESSDRYNSPDTSYGYGIPDFYKANLILKAKYRSGIDTSFTFNIFPNPFRHELYLSLESETEAEALITVTGQIGGIIDKHAVHINPGYNLLLLDRFSVLPAGIYFIKIQSGSQSSTFKLIKIK